MSTTLENEAIVTFEKWAIRGDWMGDHFGGLGVDSEVGG